MQQGRASRDIAGSRLEAGVRHMNLPNQLSLRICLVSSIIQNDGPELMSGAFLTVGLG